MLNLDSSIKYLKGAGPRKAQLFSKLGLFTIRDLLTFYPRDWIDRRNVRKIAGLQNDEYATINGRVTLADVVRIGRKLSVFKSAVTDSTGVIYAVQYKKINYRYDVFKNLQADFTPGTQVLLYGRVSMDYGVKQISIEDYKVTKGDNNNDFTRIVPIYQLTEGISIKLVRQLVIQALDNYLKYCSEILPAKAIGEYKFVPIHRAIRQIHFPEDFQNIDDAKRRLIFDEFLLLELAMIISRRQVREQKKNRTYEIKKHLLTPFRKNLGFEFTSAQKKVINEIFNDLGRPTPMNRLLLGDVGSGKTVVALSAVLLAIENGYQAAFMVPTEVLAEQHYYTMRNFVRGLDIKTELLIGSMSQKTKKNVIGKIASGNTDLVVGTHALIEQNIKFKNLALIVIDEQHRFGVLQRQKLQSKAERQTKRSSPDILIMTATPIPRTLALTIYNDLDISVIDQLPPGRTHILTQHVNENHAYKLVKKEIDKKHQAYLVFPLVDESDKLELRSAIKEGERLAKEIFSEYRVGLLHGQMAGKEKERIMIDFHRNKYDMLVTTTVIEVGIDVPNATVMVIHHADRFGLATLHQLRGRIGRSEYPSVCFILGDPKTEDARKRFEIICSTNDGFKIAEADLLIRGPGNFFGTAQHGLLELKIANILTDIEIMNLAKKYVTKLVEKDRSLSLPEHFTLRKELVRNYGGKFNLSHIL